jgi:hypothetical protein
MPSSDFRSLRGRTPRAVADAPRRGRRFRPELAPLEGRALLSTLTVQNLNDSGDGSLRAEIALAQDGDTIRFAHGLSGTMTLTSGPLVIQTGLEIKGPGADRLTVSGGGTSGVFLVESPYGTPPPPPIVVSLSGITIAGSDLSDRGLTNFGATMTLKNVTVTANQGGGIFNYGIMTVKDSEINGNTTGTPGSGVGTGGGILNLATLNVVSSDVSNNTVQGSDSIGGGILSYFGTILSVTDSTFRNNQAVGIYPAEGGAIHSDPGSTVTITGSTFVNK